jgi:signal transduction histidine kinase
MHDELGQALTAMKMDLSWLDSRLPKDQRSLLEKTKSMSKLADATLQTIKKISTQLRPELLDDLGLPAAIEWQAEEFQTRTGIKCAITVDPEDIILDKDRSTAIFRIFQETLTNVARHAKATKVKVSLKKKAGKIELKVRDNGKGITEEQASNPKSFGLIGIKERAYYLNGKVVINGLQDKGTTLTIGIPLPKKGKAR